jgi:hypothetical protein
VVASPLYTLSQNGVTVTYYQTWILDTQWSKIRYDNASDYLKHAQEYLIVSKKNMTKTQKNELWYVWGNKKIATISKSWFDDLQLTWFWWLIELSPKWKYITYRVSHFGYYDAWQYVMMNINNSMEVIKRGMDGCVGDEWTRQPDGKRYFFVKNGKKPWIKEIRYTKLNLFPESKLLMVTALTVDKISFDTEYVYIQKNKSCKGKEGIITEKIALSTIQ